MINFLIFHPNSLLLQSTGNCFGGKEGRKIRKKGRSDHFLNLHTFLKLSLVGVWLKFGGNDVDLGRKYMR